MFLWSFIEIHQLVLERTTYLTNQPTNSMEQSTSWEANRFPTSQKIPHILWNLKVHHHTHNSPPCPIPEPDQSITFLKIHFNINLASKPGFPVRSTCPAHPILLVLITRIIFRQEYRSLRSSDYNSHTHSKNAASRSLIQSARRLIHINMLYVQYDITVLHTHRIGFGS